MADWEVDTEILGRWGRLQIVIDNKDRTFYRDVPTVVESWGTAEPFSDTTCSIRFPGITSFEDLEDLPFSKFDNVEIKQIHPTTNQVVKCVFEGMIASMDDELSESDNGLRIECIGALYQADLVVKPTIFNDYTFDLATAIKQEFDVRIKHYGLRLKPMVEHTYANIGSRNRGSFNPLLTGWVQELLAKAYTSPFMIESEEAVALNLGPSGDPEGYMITGNYGSYLSFGGDFPNWGSWSYLILFLILFENKPRLAVSDSSMLPDQTGIYSVTKHGQVGIHSDTTFGNPNAIKYGDIEGHPHDVNAINVTPTGRGYLLMDSLGNIFSFGDAVEYGEGPALSDWFGHEDEYVDMALTPSGEGYYLLSKYGKVHDFGDATDFGSSSDAIITEFGVTAVSISAYEDGYYVLMSDGEVVPFGLTHHGDSDGWNANDFVDMDVAPDGRGYGLLRASGSIHDHGTWPNLGHGQWSNTKRAGGNIYQWTLLKHPGRKLEMRIKDTWTSHWSCHVGTPGITHNLTRDWTQLPNVYYGEGINQANCRWRNSKYPNIHPDDAPIWPGYNISTAVNQNTSGVRQWQQAMVDRGWDWLVTVDGNFSAADQQACMQLQANSGIEIDGIVGAQTWAATFQVGEGAGNANGAYYAPIAQFSEVDPFLYDSTGAISGANPDWDKNEVRVETFENYGEGIEQRDAAISARSRLKLAEYPGYFGTITLKTDPEEASRFNIRAGQNIVYKGYRGNDVRFHISEVSFDVGNLAATLTVDTQARDSMTLAGLIQRDKETNDPGGVRTRRQSQAKQTEDRVIVWDCEAGSGIIPLHAIGERLWNVLRIPVGEFGEVVQTDIRTTSPSKICAAIFDRPITHKELKALGEPDDEDYWKEFPEGKGLIISWGKDNNMGGYYPGREGDDDPLTGVLIDRASWVYWTTKPPFIYVALWTDRAAYIQGHLYPGTEGVGLVPDVVALPEP